MHCIIWNFGTLYSVILYEDDAKWKLYDYLSKMTNFESIFMGKGFEVISETEQRFSLIRFTDYSVIFTVFGI